MSKTKDKDGDVTPPEEMLEVAVDAERSIAKCNYAEAAHHKSETRLNEIAQEIRTIELDRVKRKTALENANDFESGYFAFNHDVNERSVQMFLVALRNFSRQFPGKAIVIELNSPGGSIIDGFQFYDELLRLRGLGHHLTIRVRGQAASMAGVLLQAADVREIGGNAFVMLHRAFFGAIGKAYEIEDEVEFVKKLEARIVDIFAGRSGHDKGQYEAMFAKRKDLWFNAEEALKQGLVDRIA